jgi:hypothetical protein
MPGTMTYVGFDVHARSAHAAAIDVMTGELSRVRFGPGIETPVDWLNDALGGGLAHANHLWTTAPAGGSARRCVTARNS